MESCFLATCIPGLEVEESVSSRLKKLRKKAHVELRNKRDPEAQAYMFYGYMAIPQVKRETQVIEHVDTTYKVV